MTVSLVRPLVLATALAFGAGLVTSTASAKEPASQEEIKEMWQAEDWKGLIKVFKAAVKESPEDPAPLMKLGATYLKAEKYDKAVEAYAQAEALGAPAHLTRYNSACAQALNGDLDDAFASLSGALEAGFSDVELIKTDTDLDALRSDSRFASAIETADKNARPCEFDERYSSLDFWVGDWVVTNGQGFKVGANTISKSLNGCALHESWTGFYGAAGESTTVFDPSSETLRQTWVSATGGVTVFEGSSEDGRIVFVGEAVAADGTSAHARMTLIANDDGTVTQIGERSADGVTWNKKWNGTYTPKGEGYEDGAH